VLSAIEGKHYATGRFLLSLSSGFCHIPTQAFLLLQRLQPLPTIFGRGKKEQSLQLTQ